MPNCIHVTQSVGHQLFILCEHLALHWDISSLGSYKSRSVANTLKIYSLSGQYHNMSIEEFCLPG